MSITRVQWRTKTQQWMDASGSTRWDFSTPGTAGEVDALGGYVHQAEWARILNANRHYRMNKVAPTTDANGFVPVTALTTGTGDAQRNFYRIVLWVFNNYIYKTGTQEEWALGQNQGVAPRVYFLSDSGSGAAFMSLPVQQNVPFDGTGSFIWVNWFPQRIDVLGADTSVVDFPNGYEELLAIETAAKLLAKGGAEVQATNDLKRLAEEMRADMLQDVSREAAKAMRAQFEDTAAMWAGN
jgi:hypothetical protein